MHLTWHHVVYSYLQYRYRSKWRVYSIYWNYCHVSKILVNKDTISKTVMKDETITANGTAIYDFKGRSKINIPGKYV